MRAERRGLMLLLPAFLGLALAGLSAAGGGAPGDELGRAMQDELQRSMERLRLAQMEKPYFIAYRVREARSLSASAMNGSLLSSVESHARLLGAEVRVGDYAFDNTNYFSTEGLAEFGNRAWVESQRLPLDDDYREIRRQIWLATDVAYKQALESLAGKRAALENRTAPQKLPDFSKEPPLQLRDELPEAEFRRGDAEALVRGLSSVLGRVPELYSSHVDFSVTNMRGRYLNSEGSSLITAAPLIHLQASASTQAPDGMPLQDSMEIFARSTGGIPSRDALEARLREMATLLVRLRAAPLLDRYNGPVLFEGAAAAELFRAEFAPALAGHRKQISANPEMEAIFMRFSGQGGFPFAEKLGARVLPDFLSVVDDPGVSEFDGQPLLGGYRADDDAVGARATLLIDHGILKTFLTTRTPVEGAEHSSGNRRGTGALPSNLMVRSATSLDDAALKERLRALAKQRGLDFAIVVREIGSGGSSPEDMAMSMIEMMTGRGGGGRPLLAAYKVFLDGHEELVRGANLAGMSAESFKDIVAVSRSMTVWNTLQVPRFNFEMMGGIAESLAGIPIVTYVVPSLLFEDVTLSKSEKELPKPPFSSPPPTRTGAAAGTNAQD